MARRNISIPDDLDAAARSARLNVSLLTRRAIVHELDRRDRMSRLDGWLDELDDEHGVPSAEVMAAAERWARGAVAASPPASRSGSNEAAG